LIIVYKHDADNQNRIVFCKKLPHTFRNFHFYCAGMQFLQFRRVDSCTTYTWTGQNVSDICSPLVAVASLSWPDFVAESAYRRLLRAHGASHCFLAPRIEAEDHS